LTRKYSLAFQPNGLGSGIEDYRAEDPKKRCSELRRRDRHRGDASALSRQFGLAASLAVK
jgi:hypothetical protein